MKNFRLYLCCECCYNTITKIFSKLFSCISKFKKGKEYSSISSTNDNIEENHDSSDIKETAKILSSEEINEMIKNQIKYSKEQNSGNGYKIIKQKNPDDGPKIGELINMEEIKKEINQIEFEEEEQKHINNNINSENNDNNDLQNTEEILDNEEEDTKLNIEELRKDVLENNDDLD